jgi:hypothetical protein
MKRLAFFEHLMPWGGLTVACAGWFGAQQFGSANIFVDCRSGSPGFVVAVNLVGLAIAIAGGISSWRIHRRGANETGWRRRSRTGAVLHARQRYLPPP